MAGKREPGKSAGAAGATPRDAPHRWAVDRVEEGTAAVEQDGEHMYEIPRWLLPAGARDGDVLAATVTKRGDGEVTITVRIDRSATNAGMTPKAAKPVRSPKDPGGDIAL